MAEIERGRIRFGIFSHLKQDIPASIAVLFVALPLCLGIALASRAPLFSGRIAGIKGMLSGIGIIIILKQIPHTLGLDKEWMGNDSFILEGGCNTFKLLWQLFEQLTPGAILIAIISMGILLLWELYLTKCNF